MRVKLYQFGLVASYFCLLYIVYRFKQLEYILPDLFFLYFFKPGYIYTTEITPRCCDEGDEAWLVSPFFDATGSEGLTFYFSKGGNSILRIGVLMGSAIGENETIYDVKSNKSNILRILKTIDGSYNTWTVNCIDNPGITGNISIVFVHQAADNDSTSAYVHTDDILLGGTCKREL